MSPVKKRRRRRRASGSVGWGQAAAAKTALQEAEKRCVLGEAYVEQCRTESGRVAALNGELQKRLEQDAAASLASLLADGEPCPVCGAVHPPPAGGGFTGFRGNPFAAGRGTEGG